MTVSEFIEKSRNQEIDLMILWEDEFWVSSAPEKV